MEKNQEPIDLYKPLNISRTCIKPLRVRSLIRSNLLLLHELANTERKSEKISAQQCGKNCNVTQEELNNSSRVPTI